MVIIYLLQRCFETIVCLLKISWYAKNYVIYFGNYLIIIYFSLLCYDKIKIIVNYYILLMIGGEERTYKNTL